MGDYNGTCAVSNLPIQGGEAVRILLGFEYSGRCGGVQNRWIISTFPLKATYDGYGKAEKFEAMNTPFECELWLKFARACVHLDCDYYDVREPTEEEKEEAAKLDHKGPAYERIYYTERKDVLIPFGLLPEKHGTLDRLMEALQQSDAFIYEGKKQIKLGYAMIREDIWQSLLTLPRELDYHLRATPADFLNDVYKTWEKYRTYDDPYFARVACFGSHCGMFFEHYYIDRSLSMSWNLAHELSAKPPAEAFAAMADLAYTLDCLSALRISLRGFDAIGPQYGLWSQHAAALEAWAKIARREADRDAAAALD